MKKLLVGAVALSLFVPTATANAVVTQEAKPGAVFTPNTGTNVDTNGFQYEMKNVQVTSKDGVNARLTGDAAAAVHISGPQGVGGHYEYAQFPVDVQVKHVNGKIYDKNGNLVYLPSSTEAATTQAATKPGTTKPGNAPVAKPAAKPVSAAVAKATAKAKASAKVSSKSLPKTSAAK